MTFLNTKEKKFSWGGRSLFTAYPAYGAVSIVGSVAGGDLAFGSEEIAKVHAAMLMEGTHSHSKKELQQMLDAMGASLSFYATATRICFSARVRSTHAEQLLKLMAEILREPAFPESELALLKRREEASLALEAQDTRAQAGIYLARQLYKKGHPNWSETTEESRKVLKSIASKKLRQLHADIISRATAVISTAGDIKAGTMHRLVHKYFGSLPKNKSPKISFGKAPLQKRGTHSQRVEHKSGIDYMSGIATRITSDHPDYAALILGVQILGNPGFNGRLMQIVREQEGLTYVAYAYANGFNSKIDGSIVVWTNFPPQTFEKGRASILREIKGIAEEGVTELEVRRHRDMYVAKVKVQLSNSGAFARVAHSLAVDGREMSYLDKFNKKILTLDAKQVSRALKKYIILDKLSESAAGPVEKNALKA